MTTELVTIKDCMREGVELEVFRGSAGLCLLTHHEDIAVGLKFWLNNESIAKLIDVLIYERDNRNHGQNPDMVK